MTTLIKMTAGQVRQIKPFRYFTLSLAETLDGYDSNDWEMVFSANLAWRINVDTGEEFESRYSNLWKDYKRDVEGLSDEQEVYVDISTYKAWKETK